MPAKAAPRRLTERKAARIETKIDRLRADAMKAFGRDQFGRMQALQAEADALRRRYVEACGVSALLASLEAV